jgi:hypothetical protein
MKILAMVTLKEEAALSEVRAQLAAELKGSWALYSSGILREVYATESPARVVFILETADTEAAADALRELPLVAADMFHIEMLELRPFVNWARLFAP